MLGWTKDFATTFDQAELLSEGSSLLSRQTSDGTQAQLVPYALPVPRYEYLGVSGNGSTVIFEAGPSDPGEDLQLTPNAALGEPNVYAWDRSDPGVLRLAGVLPDGSTPAEGSQAGKGIGAGDYSQDTHLVSANGSVFFNDREDGQLYLRLNPAAAETTVRDGNGNCIPDPVLACTVHISASQKVNGKGPEGHDSTGAQPARFLAASSAGSTVTFTSSEKLTDDATTGLEPDGPAIARAKRSDGGEKSLTFIPAFAREIAIDETGGYVYWTDPVHHRIGRAKLNGASVTENYMSLPGKEPLGIAIVDQVSDKYIFWTERGELDEAGKPKAGSGAIGRADLDGTNIDPECLKGLTNPRSIAASAGFIYWTTLKNASSGDGPAGRADFSCGSANLHFVEGEKGSGDIAVDSNYIYISVLNSDFQFGFIKRYNLDGTISGAELIQVFGVKSVPGIALDGAHLYWSDSDHNTIGRSDLAGTDPSEEPNFISGTGRVDDLAVGGEYLFWSTGQEVKANPGNDVYQLDRESGELKDLAPDTTDTNGTEVQGVLGTSEDGSYVYFAANGVPDGAGNVTGGREDPVEPGTCKGTLDDASGTCNLYVSHDGQVSFIGRLDAKPQSPEEDSGDGVDWAAGQSEVKKLEYAKSARVSADGTVLVFRSSLQLTDYHNQGPRCVAGIAAGTRAPGRCPEFYRFEYGEPGLTCLTCSPRGASPVGPAQLGSVRPPASGAPAPAMTLSRNLSTDGNRFFFQTQDALVAADTNGEGGCPPWGTLIQSASTWACQDVYEWEAPETGSCEEDSLAYSAQDAGCIYLISTGKSKEASWFLDADPEGENPFILTFERLVGQDEDSLPDVYDARVGGGLASQNQAKVLPCTGEGCKGDPAVPPAVQSPGSSGFSGPSNPKPGRHKKHKHRKHKKRKHHKQRRTANKNRGVGR